MRINQYFCVFAASLFLAGTNSLFAVTLQGACTGCFTIGSNVVTTTNPLTVFDFAESSGPSLSGDLLLDILVPNNEDSSPSSMSFTITGTPNGTAHLANTNPWTSTSVSLESYLGGQASNVTNSLTSFLQGTQLLDSGAIGFYVYQVDLGTYTTGHTLDIATALPVASYVLAFLNTGTTSSPNWEGTSNPIFEAVGTPEPTGSLLVAGGLVLILSWRKLRASVAGRTANSLR